MSKNTCVILAGGLGTRLRSVVPDKPKCLAPIRGKPFLELQLELLAKNGVDEFILALGYQSGLVLDAIKSFRHDLNIKYCIEPESLGTGGAIAFALRHFNLSEAIVANGDTFVAGNIDKMLVPLNIKAGETIRIGITDVADRQRFGGVEVDFDGRVIKFNEKGIKTGGSISVGLYRVHLDAFTGQNLKQYSIESQVFPWIASARKLWAADLNGPFIDIGVPEDYERICLEYEIYLRDSQGSIC